MTDNTPETKTRKPWGYKRDWTTHGAKFSPDESAAIRELAQTLGTTKDGVIHNAVVLYLKRHDYSEAA